MSTRHALTYAGVLVVTMTAAVLGAPKKPTQLGSPQAMVWSTGAPCNYGSTSSTLPCAPVAPSSASGSVTLKAPITITITKGDVTLDGGTLTVGPNGKTYEGGTVTVRDGSLVLDPTPPKSGR